MTLARENPFELHPELQNDAAFVDLLELYRQAAERTHTRGGNTPSELKPYEFERFIVDLMDTMRQKGWTDVIIFFDEANRLPVDLSVEFLTWNVESLNRAGIVTIYAANPEMARKFDQWSNREIHIGPFLKVEDMLRLLSRYYFGDGSQNPELPVSPSAIVKLWESSGGIPYRIQHIAGQSFSYANGDGANRVEELHVERAHRELLTRKPELFHE